MRRRNTYGRQAMSTFGRNAKRLYGWKVVHVSELDPPPKRVRRKQDMPPARSRPNDEDEVTPIRVVPPRPMHRVNYQAIGSRVLPPLPETQPPQIFVRPPPAGRRFAGLDERLTELERGVMRLEAMLHNQGLDDGTEDEPRELMDGTLQDYTFTGHETHTQCAICLTDFKVNEVIGKLQCGHIFHMDCISAWVFKHPTCPICRRRFNTV